MAPHPVLHAGYEQLIGTAVVDTALGHALLRNPRATAIEFGLSSADAEIVADIHAPDLRSFATALLPRLYGKDMVGARYSSAVVG